MTQRRRILWLAVFAAVVTFLSAHPAAAQWVYATSPDANVLSVIDPSHDTVAMTIPTPFSPGAIALTPDGKQAYVVNNCTQADRASGVAGSVTVLDLVNNVVSVPAISVGNCPNAVAVGATPNGVRTYVANSSGSVSVIDVSTNTALPSITTPGPASDVALTPDGKTLYVVSGFNGFSIDTATNTISNQPVFGGFANFVAVDSFSQPWWTGGAFITVGNLANSSFFADCTSGPVAFTPGRAFILDIECNGIYDATNSGIVNTFSFNNFGFANLGDAPNRIAISSDGSRGYIGGLLGSGSITSASATAVMNGSSVASVNVTSSGSGYVGTPAVEFLSRDQNAIAEAGIEHNFGSVPFVFVDSGGSGYIQPPRVQFVCTDLPSQCSQISPASATATISNGSVATVTVTNPGSGYVQPPVVAFVRQNFTSAQGTAIVANGRVASVTVTNAGSGYGQPPAVEFICGEAPATCGAGVASFDPGNDTQIASIPLVGADAQGLAIAPTPAPNTPASGTPGAAVPVTLTGAPITVTFQSGVTQAGFTGAIISTTGPSLQPNFQLVNPSVYYDIFTTAAYPAGSTITVCITAQGVTNNSTLVHFVGGVSVPVANMIYVPPSTLCGDNSSLSPFAIEEPTSSGGTATSASISLTPAASITYGTVATATVTVSPTSGIVAGNVTLSVDGGAAITMALLGGSANFNLGVLGAGNHSLAANFAAQGSFLGSSANGTVAVAHAPLTITANNRSKAYGQTVMFAGTEFITSGLLDTDNVSSLTLTSAGAAATAGVAGSPYPITPSAAVGSGLGNYNISYMNGALTVTPASLTITANNTTKILDAPNPASFGWIATGFVNGDNTTVLTANPTCLTAATRGSPVGSYPITCSGAAAANYTFSYVAGTLKIQYATAIGHVIQPPINADGTSVLKQGRTVPAKFDVYDVNGVAISAPGVVSSFLLTAIVSGTVTTTVEDVVDTNNPDTAFRWDGQEWIFNITTGNLSAGSTYIYTITLNDGSTIVFQYGLR
jgi:hypothetical protein